MKEQDNYFPAYRKYRNGKNYFKIINSLNFEEIRVIGSSIKLSRIFAGQYSEKMFLETLLNDYGNMAIEITEEEYEEMRKKAT